MTTNFRMLETMGDTNNPERVYLTTFVEGIDPLASRVMLGERFGKEYPSDARIELQPERMGLQLTSFLSNANMVVVARDVRAVIEKFCQGVEVEYLPFVLLDHRKRTYSSEYCIINPIGTFDCLDLKASHITWSRRTPGKINRIEKYVLDPEKAKAAPPLFRLNQQSYAYVFRPDLADAIDALKPTNFVAQPLAPPVPMV